MRRNRFRVSPGGEQRDESTQRANVTRETIACFLQIHVYHGRGGLGIVLAGAGDGSKGEIVEKVGAEMVSRDIVGWGLNLGLQQATAGQCRLLAGALPGKCSIDVGELVALLKFMQEAINTFVNKPSEEQIGVLVYTIDSMGQGDVVEEAWRVGDVDAIVKLCGNPALVTEITKARCMLQGMGYLVLVVRVSAHMGDYANYIADAGAKAGSRMEKVVEPKLGRRYVDANGDKQGSTPSWEELPGDVGEVTQFVAERIQARELVDVAAELDPNATGGYPLIDRCQC